MNILAIQSTGKETSICLIFENELLSFKNEHNIKDRPDWNYFLSQVGIGKLCSLDDINLFVFGNVEASFTATRSVISFLKGICSALNKPLASYDNYESEIEIFDIAKHFYNIQTKLNLDLDEYKPENIIPEYKSENNFKKINE